MPPAIRPTFFAVSLCLAQAACDTPDPPPPAQAPPAAEAPAPTSPPPPIRTDTTVYHLVPDDPGWRVPIPFELTNVAPDTLYAVNCNGAITLQLEKRESAGWSVFWMPITNACLSPPVVIPPGAIFRDTVEVWGAPPGGNVGPEFRSSQVEGTYRLVWTNLTFHYDAERPGFGDPVPEEYRVSNEFELRTGSPDPAARP